MSRLFVRGLALLLIGTALSGCGTVDIVERDAYALLDGMVEGVEYSSEWIDVHAYRLRHSVLE